MRCGLLGENWGTATPRPSRLFATTIRAFLRSPRTGSGTFSGSGDFQGLNVTIPYKTTMLAICDDLTETAATIGSVNTVLKQLDGSLLGDNTDAAGFEGMVWKSRIRILGRKCLVLGSRGGQPLGPVCPAEAGGGGGCGDLPHRGEQL